MQCGNFLGVYPLKYCIILSVVMFICLAAVVEIESYSNTLQENLKSLILAFFFFYKD